MAEFQELEVFHGSSRTESEPKQRPKSGTESEPIQRPKAGTESEPKQRPKTHPHIMRPKSDSSRTESEPKQRSKSDSSTIKESEPKERPKSGEILFAESTVKPRKVGLFNGSFSKLNFEGLTIVVCCYYYETMCKVEDRAAKLITGNRLKDPGPVVVR